MKLSNTSREAGREKVPATYTEWKQLMNYKAHRGRLIIT